MTVIGLAGYRIYAIVTGAYLHINVGSGGSVDPK